MRKVACFCIPAHGHTNPMCPVVAELVRRGNAVRFYSFREFEKKIRDTGAEFVACDEYLPELTKSQEAGLMRVSTTEMTIQDIHTTLNMDSFLDSEFKTFKPDVVYTDSVCFWGKLNAWKHQVPMVVSTSTFAFNQMSSQYLKQSPRELADLILGLPRISAELRKLEPLGYHVKNALQLVQSDNQTDSVVYTSERFQPYAKSFSSHYAFVGPSVFSDAVPDKNRDRPLVYISMGTVINDRPDFYGKCMKALEPLGVDVILACGNAIKVETLGALPDWFQVYPRVDQLDVLSRANVFISHCGMNSVSESLYMATPIVLYPQTNEQMAVARRAAEIGAGIYLKDDSVEGIRAAVEEILRNPTYSKAAEVCSADFRSCSGPAGAAEFIEQAPHMQTGPDILEEVNRSAGKAMKVSLIVCIAMSILIGYLTGWKAVWILGILTVILPNVICRSVRMRKYAELTGTKNGSRSG